MYEIELLKNRIIELENENQLLRQRLAEAGISYTVIPIYSKGRTKDLYDPNQGARIIPITVNDKIASNFFMMFCRGRKDVYDLRYSNPKTGKVGYYTQCYNRWDKNCHIQKRDGLRCKDCDIQAYKPLVLSLIKSHLIGNNPNGNDVVAIYPMLEENMCQFLVFDFDNHSKGREQDDYSNKDEEWKEEVDALRQICEELCVDFVCERSRSGNGAHLWIFFKELVPAKLARKFGFALLEKGAELVNLKSFRYYDRMIPTQDTLPPGGLGNVIALPLQGLALKSGNSAFVDRNWNAYPNQLDVLTKIHRLSKEEIESFISNWYGKSNLMTASADLDESYPWKVVGDFSKEDVDGTVDITIADKIYIDSTNIANKLKWSIRKLATFSNKQYFQNQAMGMPNYDESRFIYLGYDDGKYIVLPRGIKEKLFKLFDDAGIDYVLHDERCDGKIIDVEFNGKLKESQIPAVEALVKNENGILHAATAFGKTVVCCNLIAERKVNTLILVDRAELKNQWIERLNEFLIINEELPEYKTKSGQVRRRKTLIGDLQGVHDTLTGIVDVAMVRSLKKNYGFHPLLKEYGQIIMDECHHAASDSAIEVLQEVNAKFVYGVTATPKRGDGKEKINEFLLGPIRYSFTAKDRAKEQNIAHMVYPRFTSTVSPFRLSATPYGNAAFELIRNNEVRDAQIVNDVRDCIDAGRTPVVLTKYVDHAERLSHLVDMFADKIILLTGKNGTKARKRQLDELYDVDDNESLILIGTGSLLGEGFDYPRLDTLFMATPISGENVVEQYVGRLNRDYQGKENVIVYDYVDAHVPKFDKMYAARLKAYKKIGYEICTGIKGEIQSANAIYDIDNYAEVFWKDLSNAQSDIVISSPRLNTKKVTRLIEEMKIAHAMGVKVTIVTWHPDAYKYGRDDVRLELMEGLHRAGFEIKLVDESCEHFAVIDRQLVWYGSMNLLSKEDVDDNLMRVVSGNIATELLEMTFG